MSSKDAPEIIDAEFSEVRPRYASRSIIWADRAAIYLAGTVCIILTLLVSVDGLNAIAINLWPIARVALFISVPVWLLLRGIDFMVNGTIR